jgi:hypothetical protein
MAKEFTDSVDKFMQGALGIVMTDVSTEQRCRDAQTNHERNKREAELKRARKAKKKDNDNG